MFDVFQIPYSALERDHEEWITKAAEAGIGILLRGGVALGEPGVGLGKADRWDTFEKAGLHELQDEDESRSAFMLRFTLTHPHTHSIITGTTNPGHLAENVQAVMKGPLSDEVYAEAKRRLGRGRRVGRGLVPVQSECAGQTVGRITLTLILSHQGRGKIDSLVKTRFEEVPAI